MSDTTFKTMLKLRPVEYGPILASVVINVGTGMYVATNTDAMQLLQTGKLISCLLLLVGIFAWFFRLNRLIKKT